MRRLLFGVLGALVLSGASCTGGGCDLDGTWTISTQEEGAASDTPLGTLTIANGQPQKVAFSREPGDSFWCEEYVLDDAEHACNGLTYRASGNVLAVGNQFWMHWSITVSLAGDGITLPFDFVGTISSDQNTIQGPFNGSDTWTFTMTRTSG